MDVFRNFIVANRETLQLNAKDHGSAFERELLRRGYLKFVDIRTIKKTSEVIEGDLPSSDTIRNGTIRRRASLWKNNRLTLRRESVPF